MSVLSRLTANRGARLLAVGSALVLVGVVVLALVVGDGRSTADTPAAASSAPATTTAPPLELAPAPVTPEAAGPTEDVTQLPPSLPPVGLDEQAAVGNGITAQVLSLEAIEGTGTGPGNIAGPALRATIRLTNGTEAPVSLDGVAVDLAHGTELIPASPLDDPSAAPFAGTAQPSADAVGVYVFSVPAGDRHLVSLTVGYQAGAPFLVFTGSAD